MLAAIMFFKQILQRNIKDIIFSAVLGFITSLIYSLFFKASDSKFDIVADMMFIYPAMYLLILGFLSFGLGSSLERKISFSNYICDFGRYVIKLNLLMISFVVGIVSCVVLYDFSTPLNWITLAYTIIYFFAALVFYSMAEPGGFLDRFFND